MEDLIGIITIAIGSYLLGSVSFAIIFSKKIKGIDPREHGSNNPGTTNVLRTAGPLSALLTLICDVLKGALPVLFAVFLSKWTNMHNGYLLPQIAGIFAVLGHMFPIYYMFKGGKGIATGFGVILTLNWQIALILIVFFIVIVLITRYVSVGSISACILYCVLSIFLTDTNIIQGPMISFLITAVFLSSLLVFRHKGNIQRLKRGEENKISFKKK